MLSFHSVIIECCRFHICTFVEKTYTHFIDYTEFVYDSVLCDYIFFYFACDCDFKFMQFADAAIYKTAFTQSVLHITVPVCLHDQGKAASHSVGAL